MLHRVSKLHRWQQARDLNVANELTGKVAGLELDKIKFRCWFSHQGGDKGCPFYIRE